MTPEPPGMRPLRQVRKRDGRLVDFDEGKIADAIYKAALSAGEEDRFLAEELASVVALFLAKTFREAVPTIEDVQDMVERVLIETGHAGTAKAYILYREKRARLRAAETRAAEPVQRELFAPGPVLLLDAVGGRVRVLDRETLCRIVAAEAELPAEAVEGVADAVLSRLSRLRLPRVTLPVLGRLLDAEMAARDLLAGIASRGDKSLPRVRIEAALFPKEAEREGAPAERVGRALLRQYSLEEIYPPEVAEAHLSGRIHLRGLSDPTAVFAACLSPDALRPVEAAGGRADTPRQFTAAISRAARALGPHVSHGIALFALNLLVAPLYRDLDRAGRREEAWRLLAGLAGAPGLEIGLLLSPPAILAARKARGPDGAILAETYESFLPEALEFADALLEAASAADAPGPRRDLPRLVLTLGESAFADERARGVASRAIADVAGSGSVLFVLDRENLPFLGTARLRARAEDATRLTDTAMLSLTVGARAVVNLPRAALRAGFGGTGAFLREVEEAGALARRGLCARAKFLRRAAAGPDGPLAAFASSEGRRTALLDMDSATHSLGVTGLNEAVLLLTGEELHESDEALKLGLRALGALETSGGAAGEEEIAADLDAEEDPAVASRFFSRDGQEHPGAGERLRGAYTPGVALRADAPVDLAVRTETEGRLAMAVRTSTVRWTLPDAGPVAPETLLALLGKTWRNTRLRQVLLLRGR